MTVRPSSTLALHARAWSVLRTINHPAVAPARGEPALPNQLLADEDRCADRHARPVIAEQQRVRRDRPPLRKLLALPTR
jgi:hypothetical protein